jgi:hypothetical protein
MRPPTRKTKTAQGDHEGDEPGRGGRGRAHRAGGVLVVIAPRPPGGGGDAPRLRLEGIVQIIIRVDE